MWESSKQTTGDETIVASAMGTYIPPPPPPPPLEGDIVLWKTVPPPQVLLANPSEPGTVHVPYVLLP